MRERWFFVQGARRRGPLSFEQMLEAVWAAADPSAVLVWRKGLRDWTRADSVPQLESRLAQRRPHADEADASGSGGVATAAPAPAVGLAPSRATGRLLALSAFGVGLLALAGVLWLSRPRAQPLTRTVPLGSEGQEDAPAIVIPSVAATLPATRPASGPLEPGQGITPRATAAAARGVGDAEADLPGTELGKLRGVAAWSGDRLRLTVYNGTDWRITELRVKIERLAGEDFVEDPQPLALRPPPEPVDTEVADLLKRVVPQRKKAGLNALDAGVFEGQAGTKPEGFRWQIESGRGYPPQR